MELAAAWVIVWLITPQLENSHHDVHHFQVNLYMYKQLKITLIINKLLLGLKELILILYSTLFWYSYYYIYLYVCLYIHECICIDAHAHVHTHVTLCEYVSTSATVKHGCTTLMRMLYDVWKAVCCKYGNKLDLIWLDLIWFDVKKKIKTWLLIGWQHSCQPMRSQVWKSLLFILTCTFFSYPGLWRCKHRNKQRNYFPSFLHNRYINLSSSQLKIDLPIYTIVKCPFMANSV